MAGEVGTLGIAPPPLGIAVPTYPPRGRTTL